MKLKNEIREFIDLKVGKFGIDPTPVMKIAITKDLLDATGNCLLGIAFADDKPALTIKRDNWEFTITAKPITRKQT